MNSLDASIRNNKTKGQLNAISIVVVFLQLFMEEKLKIKKFQSQKTTKKSCWKRKFLSSIIALNIDGKTQNVLPREVKYHVLSDEPSHVDFLRVLPGVKIKIEVPVNFINNEKSPKLKEEVCWT